MLARSAGCRPEWVDALRLAAQRFGEAPTGIAERDCLFALRLARGPWMIVGVFPQGCDDRGRPGALAFHAVFVGHWSYRWVGANPFRLRSRPARGLVRKRRGNALAVRSSGAIGAGGRASTRGDRGWPYRPDCLGPDTRTTGGHTVGRAGHRSGSRGLAQAAGPDSVPHVGRHLGLWQRQPVRHGGRATLGVHRCWSFGPRP